MSSNLRWSLVVGAEALLVVLMLPFGFVFTPTLGLHQMQMLVLGGIGALGWVVVALRPARVPLPLLIAPLPLLSAMLITAAISQYPSLAWPAAWQTAAYAGLFWLLTIQARHPDGRRNLFAVLFIVVGLALASYLIAVVIEWQKWLALGFSLTTLPLRPGNVGGLALIPTWLADLVALGSPVLIARLWTRGFRTSAILFAVIAVGTIVLTGTRSVLFIVAAVSVFTVLIVVRGRARRGVVTAALTGVVVLGALGAVVALGSSRSFDEGRTSAYASAIARITESPLVGTGPGTYGVERMRDPVDVLGHLAFPDAHNIILNTAAESGLVGLLGLLATVAFIGIAVWRTWRAAPGDRLVIGGALFGIAVFAAHGMVDVVFGLIGMSFVAIAVVAIAATYSGEPVPAHTPRQSYLRAALGVALLALVVVSVSVVRTEGARTALAHADAALPSAPVHAVSLARSVTDAAPDLVPAWWVQMVAADRISRGSTVTDPARKMVELEGFGQQWMTLAILAWREGDRTAALDAIARATAGPPADPIVELNALVILRDAGEDAAAAAAARRLLDVQPDIERILMDHEPVIPSTVVAAARPDAAAGRLTAGDPDGALLIALSGEDRELADEIVAEIARSDPAGAAGWKTVVEAWFGDEAARSAQAVSAREADSLESWFWAWRLADRACDKANTAFWDSAISIRFGFHPTTPIGLGSGTADTRLLPLQYPTFIWRLDQPQQPYVGGTWGYALAPSSCLHPAP